MNRWLKLIFILSSSFLLVRSSFSQPTDKGLDVKEREKKGKGKSISFRLNTKETFLDVLKQNAYVFMLGNDNYSKNSGFGKLQQCYNDVRLLKRIFIHCSRINPKNIYDYRDLSLNDFLKKFNDFIDILDKDSMVIFTYSGHGAEDGALVFTDGGKLQSNMLKNMINSFNNDTILVIDACYSGNNEGPKEI